MNNVSESNFGLLSRVCQVCHSVLHPFVIETLSEVVSSMGTTGLFSVLGGKHSHFSLDHEVVQLHGLNEISVPDVTSVTDADVLHLLGGLVEHIAALLEVVLSAEDGSILLHGILHLASDLSGGGSA